MGYRGTNHRPVVAPARPPMMPVMQADATLIAQFLMLVALMSATIEYCEILQRRQLSRYSSAMRDEAASSGLSGLVRLFVADSDGD
jgi:hypothetical protein